MSGKRKDSMRERVLRAQLTAVRASLAAVARNLHLVPEATPARVEAAAGDVYAALGREIRERAAAERGQDEERRKRVDAVASLRAAEVRARSAEAALKALAKFSGGAGAPVIGDEERARHLTALCAAGRLAEPERGAADVWTMLIRLTPNAPMVSIWS